MIPESWRPQAGEEASDRVRLTQIRTVIQVRNSARFMTPDFSYFMYRFCSETCCTSSVVVVIFISILLVYD